MIKQFTNVREPGDWEHPFYYNEGALKMEIKWDEEREDIFLYLDGVEYDSLPYISPDFRKLFYHSP